MAAFASDFHFFGSRLLTKVAAILLPTAYDTGTRKMRTGFLLNVRHKALLRR